YEHRKEYVMMNCKLVGCGFMGKVISYALAKGGYNVHLNDHNDDILAKAKESIDELLDFIHEKGFLKKEAYDHARENITYEANLEKAAKDSDLVEEAVLEKMYLKIDV